MGKSPDLTDRQRLFIEEYLTCWNATRAAIRAGYSERTGRQMGAQNLANAKVRAIIDERLKQRAMGTDEVLARLAAMARGDVGDAITIIDVERGEEKHRVPVVDLAAAKENGLTWLIQQVKNGRDGVSIKMYSSLDALKTLARIHGLDRVAGPGGDDDGDGAETEDPLEGGGGGSSIGDDEIAAEAALAAGTA